VNANTKNAMRKRVLFFVLLLTIAFQGKAQDNLVQKSSEVCPGQETTYSYEPVGYFGNWVNRVEWQIIPQEAGTLVRANNSLYKYHKKSRKTRREFTAQIIWNAGYEDQEVQLIAMPMISYGGMPILFQGEAYEITYKAEGFATALGDGIDGAEVVRLGSVEEYKLALSASELVKDVDWYLDEVYVGRGETVEVAFEKGVQEQILECVVFNDCGNEIARFSQNIGICPMDVTGLIEGDYVYACTDVLTSITLLGGENASEYDWKYAAEDVELVKQEGKTAWFKFKNAKVHELSVGSLGACTQEEYYAFKVEAELSKPSVYSFTWANSESNTNAFQQDKEEALVFNVCSDRTSDCPRVLDHVLLRLDLNTGETYDLGDTDFKTNLSLELTAELSGGKQESLGFIEMELREDAPRQIYQLKLDKDIRLYRNINVKIASYTPSAQVENRLVLNASIEEFFNVDVNNTLVESFSVDPQDVNQWRERSFHWSLGGYCNAVEAYQFQLARIYDVTAYNTNAAGEWEGWRGAMDLELENSEASMNYKLRLTEGSGKYIARVRAIGTDRYTGRKMYSNKWTYLSLFEHVDSEDDLNWIYSRTFAEANRSSEKMTYANGLMYVQQEQVHLEGKNKIVASQIVQDYSGRNAVNSLPVPLEKEYFRYEGAVLLKKKVNDDLSISWEAFTAKDFDVDAPESLKAYDQSAYYEGEEVNVASAEAYPYTQTVFAKDASGRVKEQSGVGAKHSLDGGKTVRTIFAAPADAELWRLFGKEAPLAENVIKVITIDQNGTGSVSYKNLEGKVLATALLIGAQSENTDDLIIPNDAIKIVSERLDENLPNGKFGSRLSKSYFFDAPVNFSYSYKIDPKKISDLCTGDKKNCDYTIRIAIHDEDGNEVAGSVSELVIGPQTTNAASLSISKSIELSDGSYYLVKELNTKTRYTYDTDKTRTYLANDLMELKAQDEAIVYPWLETLLEELKQRGLEDFYTYLETSWSAVKAPVDANDPEAGENYYIPVEFDAAGNCSKEFVIPYYKEACEESIDGKNASDYWQYFVDYHNNLIEEILDEPYSGTEEENNQDKASREAEVAIIESYMAADAEGHINALFYTRDEVPFGYTETEFLDLMTNMLADNTENKDLWMAWKTAVGSYHKSQMEGVIVMEDAEGNEIEKPVPSLMESFFASIPDGLKITEFYTDSDLHEDMKKFIHKTFYYNPSDKLHNNAMYVVIDKYKNPERHFPNIVFPNIKEWDPEQALPDPQSKGDTRPYEEGYCPQPNGECGDNYEYCDQGAQTSEAFWDAVSYEAAVELNVFQGLCQRDRTEIYNTIMAGELKEFDKPEDYIKYLEELNIGNKFKMQQECRKTCSDKASLAENKLRHQINLIDGNYIQGDTYELVAISSPDVAENYAWSNTVLHNNSSYAVSSCELEQMVVQVSEHCMSHCELSVIYKEFEVDFRIGGKAKFKAPIGLGTEEEIANIEKVLMHDFELELNTGTESCKEGFTSIQLDTKHTPQEQSAAPDPGERMAPMVVSQEAMAMMQEPAAVVQTSSSINESNLLLNYNEIFAWAQTQAGFAKLNMGENDGLPVSLNFSFSYAGQQYSQVFVNKDGFVSFSSAANKYSSEETTTQKVIAPYASEIRLNQNSGIYVLSNGGSLYVFWDKVLPEANASESQTNSFGILLTDQMLISNEHHLSENTNNVLCFYNEMNWAQEDLVYFCAPEINKRIVLARCNTVKAPDNWPLTSNRYQGTSMFDENEYFLDLRTTEIPVVLISNQGNEPISLYHTSSRTIYITAINTIGDNAHIPGERTTDGVTYEFNYGYKSDAGYDYTKVIIEPKAYHRYLSFKYSEDGGSSHLAEFKIELLGTKPNTCSKDYQELWGIAQADRNNLEEVSWKNYHDAGFKSSGGIQLGFNFSFGDQFYDNIFVNNMGIIAFTENAPALDRSNASFYTLATEPFLCPMNIATFGDASRELNSNVHIYRPSNGDYIVIFWEKMRFTNSQYPFESSFAVILYRDQLNELKSFTYVYDEINSTYEYQTEGIITVGFVASKDNGLICKESRINKNHDSNGKMDWNSMLEGIDAWQYSCISDYFEPLVSSSNCTKSYQELWQLAQNDNGNLRQLVAEDWVLTGEDDRKGSKTFPLGFNLTLGDESYNEVILNNVGKLMFSSYGSAILETGNHYMYEEYPFIELFDYTDFDDQVISSEVFIYQPADDSFVILFWNNLHISTYKRDFRGSGAIVLTNNNSIAFGKDKNFIFVYDKVEFGTVDDSFYMGYVAVESNSYNYKMTSIKNNTDENGQLDLGSENEGVNVWRYNCISEYFEPVAPTSNCTKTYQELWQLAQDNGGVQPVEWSSETDYYGNPISVEYELPFLFGVGTNPYFEWRQIYVGKNGIASVSTYGMKKQEVYTNPFVLMETSLLPYAIDGTVTGDVYYHLSPDKDYMIFFWDKITGGQNNSSGTFAMVLSNNHNVELGLNKTITYAYDKINWGGEAKVGISGFINKKDETDKLRDGLENNCIYYTYLAPDLPSNECSLTGRDLYYALKSNDNVTELLVTGQTKMESDNWDLFYSDEIDLGFSVEHMGNSYSKISVVDGMIYFDRTSFLEAVQAWQYDNPPMDLITNHVNQAKAIAVAQTSGWANRYNSYYKANDNAYFVVYSRNHSCIIVNNASNDLGLSKGIHYVFGDFPQAESGTSLISTLDHNGSVLHTYVFDEEDANGQMDFGSPDEGHTAWRYQCAHVVPEDGGSTSDDYIRKNLAPKIIEAPNTPFWWLETNKNYVQEMVFTTPEKGQNLTLSKIELTDRVGNLMPSSVVSASLGRNLLEPERYTLSIKLNPSTEMKQKFFFGKVTVSDNGTPVRSTSYAFIIYVHEACTSIGHYESMCFKWDENDVDVIVDEDMLDYVTDVEWECDSIYQDEIAGLLYNQAGVMIDERQRALKENYENTCGNLAFFTGEEFNASYELGYHHYTLYYYDRAGNLMKTVPPAGVEMAESPEDIPQHRMVTEYQYNSLGQLVLQHTPDANTHAYEKDGKTEKSEYYYSRFWYDALGRLRFSQTAQQLKEGRYSYTQYDKLGRIVEVGESHEGTAEYDGENRISIESLEEMNRVFEKNKNNMAFPERGYQKTITQYSATDRDGKPGWLIENDALEQGQQKHLRNRVSCSYTEEDGLNETTEDRVYNYYSYDIHGNVEWMAVRMPLLGTSFVRYEYELISGKVKQVIYNEGRVDQFMHKYSYDADNRIVEVQTSTEGVIWESDARYEYYDHGPLKRVELGEDKVQGVDYTYTVQGWLKGINHPSLNKSLDPGKDGLKETKTAADAFAMALSYYNGDYVNHKSDVFTEQDAHIAAIQPNRELFNGNIAGWSSNHQATGFEGQRHEGLVHNHYTYDELNRIKSSNMQVFENGSWVDSEDYKTSYSYDANGNLLGLNRDAYKQEGQSDNLMDRLTYHYLKDEHGKIISNRLLSVHDEVENTIWTSDIDKQTQVKELLAELDLNLEQGEIDRRFNYVYDLDGNLIADAQGGITDIKWTPYGKVKEVVREISNEQGEKEEVRISFAYDAGGNRVRKSYTDAQGDTRHVFYVRDASGNLMATYEAKNYAHGGEQTGYDQVFSLIEQPIYGSDRLGSRDKTVEIKRHSYTSAEDENPTVTQSTLEYTNGLTNWTVPASGNEDLKAGGYAHLRMNEAIPQPIASVENQAEGVFRQVAVAEDKNGDLMFSLQVSEKTQGDENVALLIDAKGGLMLNSTGINAAANAYSAIFDQGAGIYDLYTIGTDRNLYRHRVDMNQAGAGSEQDKRGVCTEKNRLVKEGTFLPAMVALHLKTDSDKQYLYMLREGEQAGQAKLVRLQVNAEPANEHDMQYSLVADKYLSAMQLSADGAYLAIACNVGEQIGFDYTKAEDANKSAIEIVQLSEDGQQAKQVSKLNLGNATAVNSLDFTADGRYVYFTSLSGNDGKQIERMALATAAREQVMNTQTTSHIRRARNGKLYAAIAGQNQLAEILHSNESVEPNLYNLNMSSEFVASGVLPMHTQIIELRRKQANLYSRELGYKKYELKDHLGNIRALVSDRKVAKAGAEGLSADLLAYNNYYPFGMLQPKRYYGANQYRFGFQGQEKDDEIAEGEGNYLSYKYRVHDARIGKFLSVDPLTKDYPFYSPYAFSGNRVIDAWELEGLEPVVNNDGELIAFIVMEGQGPTQIAQVINNPAVQNMFGFTLLTKVDYMDIVVDNPAKFENVQNKEDKFNPEYKKLNMHKGEVLSLQSPYLRNLQKSQKINTNLLRINEIKVLIPELRKKIKKQEEVVESAMDHWANTAADGGAVNGGGGGQWAAVSGTGTVTGERSKLRKLEKYKKNLEEELVILEADNEKLNQIED
jgi:RHS repeat-associated protein